ncbi:precorrin-4 C(11)-methyltransferase [Prevotella sp. RM4]|uniref:precorrin-4 C(11)-methyltransferase n=1 Tax=Prevotella sp. RM4 TaxID=1200547 RepID=UPI00051C9460|nr:precorrin-4 C(11)-methyltransferase [Prevotella sp. RM4]
MQKIAIIQISDAGSEIASQLQCELGAELIQRTDVGNQWAAYDAFVFIGAMGICVRTIAPYIEDKHTDPAVVCIDSFGLNVISVLSGHIGGANDLTRHIAAHLGAHEVITTQSDNAGLWPLDTLDKQFNWNMVGFDDINACISAFVNREPTALLMDIRDAGTDFLERTLPDHVTIVNSIDEVTPKRFRLLIQVTPYIIDTPPGVLKVCYVPKVGVLGFGLASHPANNEHILEEIDEAITDNDIMPCYKRFCTIDVKRDEEFCAELRKEPNSEVVYYTAEELAKVEVPNPSPTVEKHVGTPSVCEAAAILGSNHGQLIVPKIKGKNWTAALAIDRKYLREQKGHIEIVGAGPGNPDLISVRGRNMLERADLILYAGSLVPKALTECHKPGAVVRSSADMALEEQCELMKKFYDEGKFIVRLHTGDPCIFGAIQEQMAFFDAHQMEYHITPGISSFLAAAAELQSQFTIPERCQTIILTRGEGRTPMPEKEQLHLLAKSQSTMCIFLSASIVDDVQRELLQEYPADTPVAACYHLTWPDQKIYRGVLKDLAQIVHDNHLTLTTMLVVGEAIDNRQGLSELYSKNFTHLFRKGKA